MRKLMINFLMMKRYQIIRTALLYAFILFQWACSAKDEWVNLLKDDSREEWETYIGPAFDSAGNQVLGDIPGLNKDPRNVFSVSRVDGETTLRVSGENFGGISTKKEFQNYHLRLQFKWGEMKHAPRKNAKRDSGLLYHAGGNHGADFGYWMRSQEFQIQEGDCGDYWGVAGGSFEVPAVQKDSAVFVFVPAASRLVFNEQSKNGRRCIKDPDAERPTGEWNDLDLYCFGDTAIHMVNGKTVMVLYKSAKIEKGNLVPLRKGKLQLQSEGAEIYFRKIEMRPISGIPDKVTTQLKK
jgi:hypothetical protein